jgi:cytochrome c peroxidase
MRFLFLLIPALTLLAFVGSEGKGHLEPYEFKIPRGFTPMPVSEDNTVTVEGAELGRFLFYDPILSRDSSISCATCHKQEYAFSDGGKKFSVGVNGDSTQRNTPPLFNLAWYPAMFWDGRAKSIEDQVFFPVRDHSEMDLDWLEVEKRLNRSSFYKPKFKLVFQSSSIDSMMVAMAIGQFERTLISGDSKLDKVVRGEAKFTVQELRGFEIMNDQSMGDCLHCHPTDAHLMGSSFKFSNNGIEPITNWEDYPDKGLGEISGLQKDMGRFKIPTIRNVGVTGPYMHDGRFETLEEVVDFYSKGLNHSPNIDSRMTRVKRGGVHLSDEDKAAVVAYLHCLTDSTFLTKKEFSNPF